MTIRVYASAYTTMISTDIRKFADCAIEKGDMQDFDAWLRSDRDTADLYDLIAECAGQNKTCKEILTYLNEDYEDYVIAELEFLFSCHPDEYWSDEITIEAV